MGGEGAKGVGGIQEVEKDGWGRSGIPKEMVS